VEGISWFVHIDKTIKVASKHLGLTWLSVTVITLALQQSINNDW
jgi:hypothetical protein